VSSFEVTQRLYVSVNPGEWNKQSLQNVDNNLPDCRASRQRIAVWPSQHSQERGK